LDREDIPFRKHSERTSTSLGVRQATCPVSGKPQFNGQHHERHWRRQGRHQPVQHERHSKGRQGQVQCQRQAEQRHQRQHHQHPEVRQRQVLEEHHHQDWPFEHQYDGGAGKV